MAAPVQTRVRFSSPLVRIEEVCCRSGRAADGPEECAARPGLALVRSGLFRKRVGRREVLGDANHAIFFSAGEPYRISHPAAGGDECSFFAFGKETVHDAVAAVASRAGRRRAGDFPFTHARIGARGLVMDLEIARRCGVPPMDPLEVEAMAMALLGGALASGGATRGIDVRPHRPGTRRDHRRWSDSTRMYLASRSGDRVHLAEVGRAVGCSPFHLARLFREQTGLPIHRYLTQLRLKSALLRLAGGDKDLARAGLEAGFSSHSHFTTAFRRETGVTPSQFRGGLSAATIRRISKNLKV